MGTINFYELRIKYILKVDGSLFVDYTTVGANSKEDLARSVAYRRKRNQVDARGDVEISVKDINLKDYVY